MKYSEEFEFMDMLNVQNAKDVTQLETELGEMLYEIECLKLELEHYRMKEIYGE